MSSPHNELAWTMIYASILGISYHPRQMESGSPSLTPEEAARITDAAMLPWKERFGGSD